MMYELPKSLVVCGSKYEIRSDYRAVLDICAALNDPDLDDSDRGEAALTILYPDFEDMPPEHYDEATNQLLWFINGGEEPDGKKTAPLMCWEQDFALIVSPINRVYGSDVRAVPYDPKTNTGGLHWWTFLSAYREIGDCLFAQVVRIREKKAAGEKLSKEDWEFYKKNQKLVDIKTTYSAEDQDILNEWT